MAMSESPSNSVSLDVPLVGNDPLSLPLSSGDIVFIMGANGTGKSSLIHKFFADHSSIAKWISAQRRTSFNSGTVDITPQVREEQWSSIQNRNRKHTSRFKDTYEVEQPSIALFDLVDSERVNDRDIVSLLREQKDDQAKELASQSSPLETINMLLSIANLPLTITVMGGQEVVATKSSSVSYSIAEMSDGERNAVLMAANVVTAKEGTLFLIDEPERHLHRSIITPLLGSLFRVKSDCIFVISTHEVGFATDFPKARTILLDSCQFSSGRATVWDASVIPEETIIGEDLRADILGTRRKILFVEGRETSLDKRLYALLFPGVAIVPKGSNFEVERSVKGVRDCTDLHWVEAIRPS